MTCHLVRGTDHLQQQIQWPITSLWPCHSVPESIRSRGNASRIAQHCFGSVIEAGMLWYMRRDISPYLLKLAKKNSFYDLNISLNVTGVNQWQASCLTPLFAVSSMEITCYCSPCFFNLFFYFFHPTNYCEGLWMSAWGSCGASGTVDPGAAKLTLTQLHNGR